MSYFQLDREILTSTMWATGTPEAIKLWVYLLLSADPRTGTVRDTLPALALRNGLSLEEVRVALDWLSEPDEHSRSQESDGRRIEMLESGEIRLITYQKHREKDHSTERVKAWRKRETVGNGVKRSGTVGNGKKRSETAVGTKDKDKDKNTTNGNGLRIAEPPAPPITLVDPPWSREACDDWIARFEGTAPGGPIGRHLKPLVEKYGWPPVRAAWRAYLAETESQFANPARFAATYGTWKRAPAAPAAPPEPPPPPADPEAYQFFDAMKLRLSGVVPLQSHATWLRPVDGRAWEGACLVLACPSKEHAAQMRAWSERLRSAAKELGYPGNERDSITFRTVVIREPEYLHDGSIR